jgi:WD40 repeat protein
MISNSEDGESVFLSSGKNSYEFCILDPIREIIYSVSSEGKLISMNFEGEIVDSRDLGFREPVSGGSISKNGNALAIASEDASVRVYALSEGVLTEKCIHTHAAAAKSCSMSKSGRILATCSDDRSVCVWDNSTETLLHKFDQFSGAVLSVCISDEERWVAAVSSDMTVVLVDLHEQKTFQAKVHAGSVTSIAFLEEQFIVTASQDRTMKLSRVGSFDQVVSIEFDVPISAIAVDGPEVAVGDNVGSVHIFDFSHYLLRSARATKKAGRGR